MSRLTVLERRRVVQERFFVGQTVFRLFFPWRDVATRRFSPNVRRLPSIIPASRRGARAANGGVGVFGDFPFFSFSLRRTLETPVRFRYNRRNCEKTLRRVRRRVASFCVAATRTSRRKSVKTVKTQRRDNMRGVQRLKRRAALGLGAALAFGTLGTSAVWSADATPEIRAISQRLCRDGGG